MQLPEVAVIRGAVHVRWTPDEPWTVLQRDQEGAPAASQVPELPRGAVRMVGLPARLANATAGDVFPLAGIAGDCPLMWQVYQDSDESWWCCTLPSGHEYGPDGVPHVAASYSRVDAVLTPAQARQGLARQTVRINIAAA